MSKLEYVADGIYPEVRGTADSAHYNADQAVYYSHLLVLDDFPQVYYVRNQLTPDLESVRRELEDIVTDIQKMDGKISELTEVLNNATRTVTSTVPEQRKRMIL